MKKGSLRSRINPYGHICSERIIPVVGNISQLVSAISGWHLEEHWNYSGVNTHLSYSGKCHNGCHALEGILKDRLNKSMKEGRWSQFDETHKCLQVLRRHKCYGEQPTHVWSIRQPQPPPAPSNAPPPLQSSALTPRTHPTSNHIPEPTLQVTAAQVSDARSTSVTGGVIGIGGMIDWWILCILYYLISTS